MSPLRSFALAGVVLALVLAHHAHWNRKLAAIYAGLSERVYPDTAAWLEKNLPANAVILSMQTTGALHYYTQFTFVRWDQVTPEQFPHLLAAIRAENRPLYASYFPFEIDDWKAFERVPGPWKRVATIEQATVWQWDDSGATAIVNTAPR